MRRSGSAPRTFPIAPRRWRDRKSTRLNSSHVESSYAVFCLKKKNPHLSGAGVIPSPEQATLPRHGGAGSELVNADGRAGGVPLFFFNDAATAEIYPLSLHDALPIFGGIAVGDPRHAAELTTIPRPPDGA